MGRKRGTRRLLRSEAKVVQRAATTIGLEPDGEAGSIQYNNSGSFTSSERFTFLPENGLELTGTLHTQGNLGINTSGAAPTHGITLPDTSTSTGQVKANAFVTYSSIRFKKDVQKLDNAMDIINQLEGVSYKWKDTNKQDYGFIAEEVGRVLPDIVEWHDGEEYATSMDYMRIISFLVEAVKFQHHKLNELEERVDNGSE
jgi:hypothetical protein